MNNNINFRDFFNILKYSFFNSALQLISFLFLAFLIPKEFGVSLFWIILILVLRSFIKINYYENNASKVKKYYNSAFFLVILLFFIASLVSLFISFFIDKSVSEILRFFSIILFLSSLSIVPESFFINRNEYQKIYVSKVISQLFFLISFPLIFFGYKSESIFYGFIIYFLVYSFLLYKKMPYALKPKYERTSNINIGKFLATPLFFQTLLLASCLVFDYNYFTYFFISFYLGFFIYEAILEPISYLTNYFKSLKNDELLKISFVRIVEYLNFVSVPYFMILIVFFGDFLNLFKYKEDMLFLILISGFLSLSKITFLIYKAKDKLKLIRNFSIFEFVFTIISLPLLSLLNNFSIWFFFLVLIGTIFNLIIFRRIMRIDLITRDYFYTFFAGLLVSLVMAFSKEYFELNFVNFVIIVFFGKVFYLILTFLFNKDLLKRIIRFLYSYASEKQEQ